MATETGYTRTETLPTNMLGQFYAGVPGQNVPGIMPLLNQDLVNKIMGFGVEGANPYTYTGERIAGFTPAQEEAFRLTAQGVGGYQPYLQGAEDMIRGGVGTARDAFGTSAGLIGEAIGVGERSTAEGAGLLRKAPKVAGAATGMGIGQLLGAGRNIQGARELAEGAGLDLSPAQNIVGGSLGNIQSATELAEGAGLDLSPAQNIVGGSLGSIADSALTGYGSTRMFDPRSTQSFYNPYEEDVVQQTLKDVREGLAQGDIARRASAIGSGAFGGSRSRLLGEEMTEAAARGAAEQVGAIRSAGFGDAARRAQSAFETQQARQAGQANLLGQLAGQQAGIGSQLGQLGLAGQRGQLSQVGALGQLAGQQAGIGSQLGQLGLAGQSGQLSQAGALGQLAGQQAGIGTSVAGLGTNLGNLLGRTAGGLGALGGNLANVYGQGARDIYSGGAGLGQLGLGAGSQLAGLGSLGSNLMGTDISRLAGMGGMQQGLDQRGLDLAYGNFVGQYNLPMQTIGSAAGLASGLAPSMGGTTVQQTSAGNTTNPLMQTLGTAATLYGATK